MTEDPFEHAAAVASIGTKGVLSKWAPTSSLKTRLRSKVTIRYIPFERYGFETTAVYINRGWPEEWLKNKKWYQVKDRGKCFFGVTEFELALFIAANGGRE